MKLATTALFLLLLTVGCARSKEKETTNTTDSAKPSSDAMSDSRRLINEVYAVGEELGEAQTSITSQRDSSSASTDATKVFTPNDLKPNANCIHPEVVADCADGFCRIPAGCFIMGARRDEPFTCKYSCIQVQVALTRGFLIGETEVTREQWAKVGWDFPERNVIVGTSECLDPHCPIANVTSLEAMAFSNLYSENHGLAPCYELSKCTGTIGKDFLCETVLLTSPTAYECEGYRLPTEAEWEYAARAGTKSAYYSGEIALHEVIDCYLEPNLEDISWYCWNSEGRAHPVATKKPNAWGLYDVLGNVAEWTSDLFSGTGYGQGPLQDPPGVLTPEQNLLPNFDSYSEWEDVPSRVDRGGAYTGFAANTAVWRRGQGNDYLSSTAMGFRLVRTEKFNVSQ